VRLQGVRQFSFRVIQESVFVLEALVESQNRTVRGNKILIALRLFLATVALAILLLQQGLAARNLKRDARTVSSRGEVTALQFDPHGGRLYSGATDTSIRIWEMPARTRYAEFISTRTHPRVIAISPDGKKLACGGEDRLVQVFDTVAPALPLLFNCEDHDPNSTVTSLAWSADGSKLLSGGGNNPLRVWNGKTGELIKAGGDDSQHSAYAAFVPGGNSIVSVTEEGQIKLFNGATLVKEADVGEHGRPVLAAALAPNGRSLLTGGQSIKSWDLQTRNEANSYDFGRTRPQSGLLDRWRSQRQTAGRAIRLGARGGACARRKTGGHGHWRPLGSRMGHGRGRRSG
jgi:WD40 repeat protein